jgi:type 1 glutamine amidotransferase
VGSVGQSADIQAKIKHEDWNDYMVIAKGNHLQHFINGQQTVDVVDEQASKAAKSGILALQIHQGPPMDSPVQEHSDQETGVNRAFFLLLLALAAVAGPGCVTSTSSARAPKKIVLVAGRVSHGTGEHEFRAGALLLKDCLDQVPGVQAIVVTNGWPADVAVFEDAAAILIYADGGDAHPFIRPERLQLLDGLMKRGVGLGAVHYGVEVPKERGGPEFLRWIGGYFEMFYSVNPHWDANFTQFPQHPITRGVQPFKIRDEWYYHMRFPEGMKGVTPLLTDVPPERTRGREGESSSHGGNPGGAKAQGRAGACDVVYRTPGWRPRLRLHRRPFPSELG